MPYRDPLLPAAATVTVPVAEEETEGILVVPGGTARPALWRVPPGDVRSLWGAPEQHSLRPLIDAGLDTAGRARVMDALLERWHALVTSPDAPPLVDGAAHTPGAAPSAEGERPRRVDGPRPARDTAAAPEAVERAAAHGLWQAGLSWPSRDTAMVDTLLGRRMVPKTVLAIRPSGRPAPPPAPGVSVRLMAAADLERAVELRMESLRWEAQFGAGVVRAGAEGHFREHLVARLAAHPGWTWVAEDTRAPEEGVCGLLFADPPEHTAWLSSFTSAPAPGYLASLTVAEECRGAGIGASLAHAAHTALEKAGAGAVALHYSAQNPLSAPFWHRCGYRPLWTVWNAQWERPAPAP